MSSSNKPLNISWPSQDASKSGIKPPPLLSRRRFKGHHEVSEADTESSLEIKNLKFEKHILEQLIKDKDAQLEKLAKSFRHLSLKLREMSRLRESNNLLSPKNLKNMNSTIFKALEDERKKHEDERKKQEGALRNIDQIEKFALAVLEPEIVGAQRIESQYEDAHIPITLAGDSF